MHKKENIGDNLDLILSKKNKKIYETIYQAISLSIRPLLKTLMNTMNTDDKTSMSTFHQFILSSHLLWELQNILNPQYVLSSIKFDQIIDGMKEIFDKYCEYVFNTMKEQEKSFYCKVLALNLHILDIKNNKKSIKKNANIFSSLSIEKLFKVDILSIFFMKSQYYGKNYHSKNAIFSPKLLMRIFNLDEKQYELYSNKFTQLTKMINFKYKDQFDTIIDLFCLVEMKIRISNMIRRFGRAITEKFLQQRSQLQVNSQQSNIVKQQFFEEQVQYKYSLCQLFLVHNILKDIDNTPNRTQNKIVQRLDCILNKLPEIEIGHQILKINIQWNVTFRSIVSLFLRIKNNSKFRVAIIRQKQQKITELNACRWIFLKKAGLIQVLQNLLPNISIEQFSSKQNHDHIMTFLCRLIVERFRLHSTVLIAQRRIERYLLIPSIYACRFQYHYDNLQQYSESSFNEKSSDPSQKDSSLISTVIVISNGFNIVMGVIAQERIQSYRFIKILAEYFRVKDIQNANLILYQLSFDRIFLDNSLTNSIANFKINHNSHVYISNSTQEFQLHFAINAYVTSGLARNNPSKSSFHQIIENQAMKIMTALQSPQIYPKSLFNQYSIKEAIGSINYQNFHLELNEENKRQEVLKFYRCTFQNAKFYQNNQQYRSYWNQKIYKRNNSKTKSCVFENIQPFQSQNLIKGLNVQDMKELKQRQSILAAHFVSQMKWRHTYLTHEETESIREDLHCFMKQHHLQAKFIKALLGEVARNLLVYQAYFHNILHECAINQTQEDLIVSCQNEISFLTKIYQFQNYHIEGLLPGFRDQFFTTFINCQMFPGINIKLHIEQLSKQFENKSANRTMVKKQEGDMIQHQNSVFILNFHNDQLQQPEYSANKAYDVGQIHQNIGQYDCNRNDEEQFYCKANEKQFCQKQVECDINENKEQLFEGKLYGQIQLCQKFGQDGINIKCKSQYACKASFEGKLCQKYRQFDCNDEQEEKYVQPRQYLQNANVEGQQNRQSYQLEFQQ